MANRRCRLLDGFVMATVRVLRSIVDLWACAGWGFLHRHPVVMGDREGGLPAYRRTREAWACCSRCGRYVTRWRTDKCVEARPGWGRRADTGMCECEYKSYVHDVLYSYCNLYVAVLLTNCLRVAKGSVESTHKVPASQMKVDGETPCGTRHGVKFTMCECELRRKRRRWTRSESCSRKHSTRSAST